MMRAAIVSIIFALLSASLISANAASAQALPKLSQQLAGKSLQCGLGTDLYFDPGMRTASNIDGVDDLFPIVENQTTIEPARIKTDDAHHFEVILTTQDGEVRHRFELRNRIFLRVGDLDGDDECVIAEGRAAYLRTRYNMIREGICGNDPKESCEDALEKTCGSYPEAACVRQLAPVQR